MRLLRVVVMGGAMLAAGSPVLAQGLRYDLRTAPPPWAARTPRPVMMNAAAPDQEQLPCLDCEPRRKRFWPAAGEVFVSLAVPWAYNYYVRDADFAHISLESMWENITGKWVWDDNTFQTNQIAHPLHGSFYYNAFRTNGYNFWASSAAAITGAYLWECCGETHPPSQNDLINTSLGGIALGEMMFRLSNLALDNTATGSERTWREIGGFLLQPWNGFNRFVRGQSNDVVANPPEWRPAWAQGALDVGVRALGSKGSSVDVLDSALNDITLDFLVVYGRPVDDLVGKPFSTFSVSGEFAIGGEGQSLNVLTAYGGLGGRVLRNDGRVKHTLAAKMNYQYYFFPGLIDTLLNDVIYNYGAQSFTGGLHSAWQLGEHTRLGTEVALRGVALAGVRSDAYVITGEGRNYDFGPGAGFKIGANLAVGRRFLGSIGYDGTYIHSVNGSDYDHYLDQAHLDLRYFLSHRVGVGVRYDYFHRDSRPTDAANPSTNITVPSLRLFSSVAIPRFGDDIAPARQ